MVVSANWWKRISEKKNKKHANYKFVLPMQSCKEHFMMIADISDFFSNKI